MVLPICVFAALIRGTPAPREVSSRLLARRDLVPGYGPTIAVGDTVNIEFVAKQSSGVEIANTLKRGLSYTLTAKPSGEALASALIGMREGGEREVTATYDAPVPGVVPANTPVIIWIKVKGFVPSSAGTSAALIRPGEGASKDAGE